MKQNINDPAHQLMNTIKDLIGLWFGAKNSFGTKRKAFSRLVKQTQDRILPPWQTAKHEEVDWIVGSTRLPDTWAKSHSMFGAPGELKTAETLLFAGPYGVYLLYFMDDIDEDLRGLFVRFLFALEAVQAHQQTTSSLKNLQEELTVLLATFECRLPISHASVVKHILLHATLFIESCGPFREHSMLDFERFHTFMKRLITGRKNMLVTFHKNYQLSFATSEWRSAGINRITLITLINLITLGDDEDFWPLDSGLNLRSTITGARPVDWTERVAIPNKHRKANTLTSDELSSLQDLYAIFDKKYDKLRDRYRNSIGQKRGREKSTSQLPSTWTPKTGKPLTEIEKSYLGMSSDISCMASVKMNKYKFRTKDSQRYLKTDNCAIKGWYIEQDSEEKHTAMYGFIKRIFVHENFPNGE